MPDSEEQWNTFRTKLEEGHLWPCRYTFKCIVKAEYYCELDPLKEWGEHSIRQSSNGKYLSFTVTWQAADSAEVIRLYRQASAIPEVMLL